MMSGEHFDVKFTSRKVSVRGGLALLKEDDLRLGHFPSHSILAVAHDSLQPRLRPARRKLFAVVVGQGFDPTCKGLEPFINDVADQLGSLVSQLRKLLQN